MSTFFPCVRNSSQWPRPSLLHLFFPPSLSSFSHSCWLILPSLTFRILSCTHICINVVLIPAYSSSPCLSTCVPTFFSFAFYSPFSFRIYFNPTLISLFVSPVFFTILHPPLSLCSLSLSLPLVGCFAGSPGSAAAAGQLLWCSVSDGHGSSSSSRRKGGGGWHRDGAHPAPRPNQSAVRTEQTPQPGGETPRPGRHLKSSPRLGRASSCWSWSSSSIQNTQRSPQRGTHPLLHNLHLSFLRTMVLICAGPTHPQDQLQADPQAGWCMCPAGICWLG